MTAEVPGVQENQLPTAEIRGVGTPPWGPGATPHWPDQEPFGSPLRDCIRLSDSSHPVGDIGRASLNSIYESKVMTLV